MIGAMPPTVHIIWGLLSPANGPEMACSQGNIAQAPIASAEIHAGPEESMNHRCCAAVLLLLAESKLTLDSVGGLGSTGRGGTPYRMGVYPGECPRFGTLTVPRAC